ncbi:MAG: hypothetical protein K6F58_07455 [Bacteroidales bacterium]|nr:hypothetical protein [Bacteroidales bacterium]
MKFKSFFALATLAALAFAGCQPNSEKIEAPASISLDKTTLELFVAKDAPSQTIQLTSTRDWRVESQPEWVVLDQSEGKGSEKPQTITVSVEDNESYNRSGDIVFTIGIRKAPLQVSQEGSKGELVAEGEGTVESPFNVLGAIEYVKGLKDEAGEFVASEKEVYIKGTVAMIEEAYSFGYGNGTFFITDDGTINTPKFYCFRVYYLGGEKWTIVNPALQKGDEVVVQSKVINYKGNTPETVQVGSNPGPAYNGKLYSLNGSTEPLVTERDFSNAPEKTVAEFIAAADKNNFYKLRGAVSGFNSTYCSFDLSDGTDTIYVYSVANADAWKSKIANKDTVVLAGAYDFYKSKNQHEVVSAWIMELVSGPQQTEFEDLTVAEFIRKADTELAYRLSGTVSGFTTGKDNSGNPVMSFNLSDQTDKILVYGFKAGEYDKWATQLSNRGTVTLHGVYKAYTKDGVTTPEVMEAVIESFEPAPPQTEFEEISIASFLEKKDTVLAYRLHGTVSSLSIKSDAEKMEFNLTDESESTVKVYGFQLGQFGEWSEKLKNGGTAVLRGIYTEYVAKDGTVTPEVIDTFIESFEEAPEVEEQAEGDGSLEHPYNPLGAKNFIDSQSFDANAQVYVAGKVSEVKYQYDAEHGTATFNISSDGTVAAQQFVAFSLKYLGNKSWLAGQKNVKIGDVVVIYGKLKKYNSDYENASGAYLYSLNGETTDDSPLFGVESQTVNVFASATSAVINVTGNVAWTATSTCTLSTAGAAGAVETGTEVSGNGAGAITVSFDANPDEENTKEYKVTVSTVAEVAVKSYEVTIIQAKNPGEGGGDPVVIAVAFDKNPATGFPTATGTKTGTFKLEGYDFVFNAATGFYWSEKEKCLIIGKANSYIELPAVEGKKLTLVEFLTGKNASENVIADLYTSAGSALNKNTAKLKKGSTYTWELEGEVNAKYRIQITNAYNAQFQTIKLKYE